MVASVRSHVFRPLWLALAVSLLLFGRLGPEDTARALPANEIPDAVVGQNGSFTSAGCGTPSATTLCVVDTSTRPATCM
jgi:hypothetical protein